MRKKITTYLALIGLIFVSIGCDSDNADQIPTLLPAEGFSLRTDLFQSPPQGAGNHFTAAAERLGPAARGFREYLDLPVAISIASESLSPAREGDEFVWRATTDYQSRQVDFELTAKAASTDVFDWFLNVTDEGASSALVDFEVVRARSLANGSLGEWNHYAMINGLRSLIIRGQYGVVGLDRFVSVSAEDSVDFAIAGDSLEYKEFTGDIREFLWFDGDSDNAFFVQWQAGSKAGLLIATDYNDSAQSCWDTSLADVDCE